MCQPCCLPIGCVPITKTIEKPNNYTDVPAKIYCPKCTKENAPIFKQTTNCCCVFFIPFIPCGSNAPAYGCPNCDFTTQKITGQFCNHCDITTAAQSEFCPSCGYSRNFSKEDRIESDRRAAILKKEEEELERQEKLKREKREHRGREIGDFRNK